MVGNHTDTYVKLAAYLSSKLQSTASNNALTDVFGWGGGASIDVWRRGRILRATGPGFVSSSKLISLNKAVVNGSVGIPSSLRNL